MSLTDCTVARNLAEDNPDLPEAGQYYYRGGGIYLGGGSLSVVSSTVVENEVNGNLAIFSNKPNMGGGGIAATIGDAHVVENMSIQHSIVLGNKLGGAANDVFSGTVLNFYSYGYNLFGVLDFSQLLVPVPLWLDLNRKHYPKLGDRDGVQISDGVAVEHAQHHDSVLSAGTDAGQPAVLWYPPSGSALGQIPASVYTVTTYAAGYTGSGAPTDDFLNQVLKQVRTKYGATLGDDFGSSFGDMTGTTFYGPVRTWPSNSANAPWIAFWRNLDTAIGDQIGTAKLGEDFWGSFSNGAVGNEIFTSNPAVHAIQRSVYDQRGAARNRVLADIGAIEH